MYRVKFIALRTRCMCRALLRWFVFSPYPIFARHYIARPSETAPPLSSRILQLCREISRAENAKASRPRNLVIFANVSTYAQNVCHNSSRANGSLLRDKHYCEIAGKYNLKKYIIQKIILFSEESSYKMSQENFSKRNQKKNILSIIFFLLEGYFSCA